MTKSEREAFAQKSAELDNLQNLLQKGTYPGLVAKEVVRAQAYVYAEWQATQEILEKETKRINDLIDTPEKVAGVKR